MIWGRGSRIRDRFFFSFFLFYEQKQEVLSLQPMIPPKRFDIFPPVLDAQKVQMRSIFSSKEANRVLKGAVYTVWAII